MMDNFLKWALFFDPDLKYFKVARIHDVQNFDLIAMKTMNSGSMCHMNAILKIQTMDKRAIDRKQNV